MLFALSVIFVIANSYLITSVLKPRNFISGFIYFIITAFAQVVLVTELLSPFKLLYTVNFLILQAIILLTVLAVWLKSGKPLFKKVPDIKSILKNILADKALIVLSLGFVLFLAVSLFLCIVMELSSGDAQIYHAARALFWANNHSINHFFTPQVRMLAFPVNSEILYTWVILFTNKMLALSLFSFIGFILSIVSLYGVMSNFSIKRRLWVIFILSSFASVLVQASGTETDIIISGLVLASMYLFKESILQIRSFVINLSETSEKRYLCYIPLFMSAMCYAIAVGTKTTAFFLIPAVALYMIYNSYKILNKNFVKPFLYFIGFGIINFLIFSAYNYIENILWFSNPLGSFNTVEMHRNFYGLKGLAANSIKNFVLFFDFTGFTWNAAAGKIIIPLRDILLDVLNLSYIPDGINSGNSGVLNNAIIAPLTGCGILGLIVFIPSVVYSLVSPMFRRNKNRIEYFLYALMFVVTFVVMSYSIVFMTYNNRFIASFIVVCAPVIGWTYFRKFGLGKWFIVFFAMFYLTLVSTHLWHQPVIKICDALFVKHQSLKAVQQRESWTLYKKNLDRISTETKIANVVRSYPKETKFVIFPSYGTYFAQLERLNNEGYYVDIKVLEIFDINDLKNYDIVIYGINDQSANIAYRFEQNKDLYFIKDKKIVFKNEMMPINCIYFSRDNKVITGDGDNPTGAQCVLSEKYLYNAGYRLDNIVYKDVSPDNDTALLAYMFLKKIKTNNK